MTEETTNNQSRSFLPYILVGVLLVILVVLLYLWNRQSSSETTMQPVAVQPQPVATEPEPVASTETQQPEPQATEPEPQPEPVEAPPPPPPKPVDTSDKAVEKDIASTSSYEALPQILVKDDLLNRFVVFVDNLANNQIARSHELVKAPTEQFKVYQQADRTWIDASSYKRYSLYTDIFTSMDSQQLITLLHKYQPAIDKEYAEIGSSQASFNDVLKDAIEQLLDTPEVPTPVEVKTDSVMYKYVDPRLEALSPVQKQLLRTGPENMRRIKNKLREIKDLLDKQN